MTMTQQERDALTQNWDQAKTQIQSQYPDLSEDDIEQGRQTPDQFANVVASKTGQDATQVEQQLRQVAQGFTNKGGGSQGQSQGQR